jgi:hypothetical protein
VTLALKNGSSGGVSYVDVKYALSAFQAVNKCFITVVLTINDEGTWPELEMELLADTERSVAAAPVHLVSQKLRIGSNGPQTMEAAILQGLYSIDAQLAESEFARRHSK